MTAAGFWLNIELLDDVVLSATSATEGGHESLDYIPGSTLRGVVASQIYRKLGDDVAWLVFHAGKVRFGNAYPITEDGLVGFPAPLSAHYPKAIVSSDLRAAGHEHLFNLQDRWPMGAGQPEQLRKAYLVGDGRWLKVLFGGTIKTAINPESGTAAEGQLFSYSTLAAGQRFAAWIGFDREANDLIDRIRKIFSAGRLHLGRSRSAEFGRARCEVGPLTERPALSSESRSDGVTTVYCLSDLALVDEVGMPVREPTAEAFALAGGKIDWNRTFLRTRSLSLFNRALGSPETERILIEKGSVLAFTGAKSVHGGLIEVGAFREVGCGIVWINPPFLRDSKIGYWTPIQSFLLPQAEETLPRDKSGELAQFECFLLSRIGATDEALVWARRIRPEIEALYGTAALLSGRRDGHIGPSASQWARIYKIAEDAKSSHQFFDRIGNVIARSRIGTQSEDEDWGAEGFLGGRYVSFGRWLGELRNRDGVTVPGLRHLAHAARGLARERAAR